MEQLFYCSSQQFRGGTEEEQHLRYWEFSIVQYIEEKVSLF